jgi:hypothetical protein
MPLDSLPAMPRDAGIATTRDIYAPRTPTAKLHDELATYGRDPEKVARQARKELDEAKNEDQG